jgi:hypothetical protein
MHIGNSQPILRNKNKKKTRRGSKQTKGNNDSEENHKTNLKKRGRGKEAEETVIRLPDFFSSFLPLPNGVIIGNHSTG